MLTKILKIVFAVLCVVIIGVQFNRPVKNNSNDQSRHLSTLYPLPDSIDAILTAACYDCHSNNTRYPWYAEIQPVGLWMDGHIRHGKGDLNFSEFSDYSPRKQFRRLEQAQKMVDNKEMPLPSYTIIHKDAVLTDPQKQTLFAWINATRDSMKARFHPDSLKGRRR